MFTPGLDKQILISVQLQLYNKQYFFLVLKVFLRSVMMLSNLSDVK